MRQGRRHQNPVQFGRFCSSTSLSSCTCKDVSGSGRFAEHVQAAARVGKRVIFSFECICRSQTCFQHKSSQKQLARRSCVRQQICVEVTTENNKLSVVHQ